MRRVYYHYHMEGGNFTNYLFSVRRDITTPAKCRDYKVLKELFNQGKITGFGYTVDEEPFGMSLDNPAKKFII